MGRRQQGKIMASHKIEVLLEIVNLSLTSGIVDTDGKTWHYFQCMAVVNPPTMQQIQVAPDHPWYPQIKQLAEQIGLIEKGRF